MAAELPPGLKPLLEELDDTVTTVPDEVTQYALRKAGVDCKDVRTLRLVSVAAQKFVAGVLDEAVNTQKRRRLAPPAHQRAQGLDPKDKRLALTTEDLSSALADYGVSVKRAPYYADSKPAVAAPPVGTAGAGVARQQRPGGGALR